MRRVVAGAALLLCLTACGSDTSAPTPAAPQSGPVAPASLTFSDVGVENAPLAPTGLDAQGAVAVPPVEQPQAVEYVRWSPELAPGRPLVVLAHVSGRDAANQAVPGAFADLDDAELGDEFSIRNTDGKVTEWVVRDVRTELKNQFPTNLVYDPRPVPTVVLVTCGGDLDPAARSFKSNVLVFAEPA